MNKPEILGVEVLTPDGRGSILSLHNNRVIVRLNTIGHNQVMKGAKREEMNYAYEYHDVEIIKGQYCFNDERIKFQYDNTVERTFIEINPLNQSKLQLFSPKHLTSIGEML